MCNNILEWAHWQSKGKEYRRKYFFLCAINTVKGLVFNLQFWVFTAQAVSEMFQQQNVTCHQMLWEQLLVIDRVLCWCRETMLKKQHFYSQSSRGPFIKFAVCAMSVCLINPLALLTLYGSYLQTDEQIQYKRVSLCIVKWLSFSKTINLYCGQLCIKNSLRKYQSYQDMSPFGKNTFTFMWLAHWR